MGRIEVRDDGIYQNDCCEYGEYSKLILSKEALSEAMYKWFGVAPKMCEYYKNGYCLNTNQCLAVSCNGQTSKCDNGKW